MFPHRVVVALDLFDLEAEQRDVELEGRPVVAAYVEGAPLPRERIFKFLMST